MNKLAKPFRKTTTHVFFFSLFFVLLSWPILTVLDQVGPPSTTAVYLFTLWLTMIGVLFVFGRISRQDLARNVDENQEPDRH